MTGDGIDPFCNCNSLIQTDKLRTWEPNLGGTKCVTMVSERKSQVPPSFSQIWTEYQYIPEPRWICLSPPAASCRSWWSPGSSWAWRSWCGVTSAGNACCSLPPTGAPARCDSLCSDDAHQAPGYPAKTETSYSSDTSVSCKNRDKLLIRHQRILQRQRQVTHQAPGYPAKTETSYSSGTSVSCKDRDKLLIRHQGILQKQRRVTPLFSVKSWKILQCMMKNL